MLALGGEECGKYVDSGSHKGACTFTIVICTAPQALAILLLIITKVCVYTTRLYTSKSKTTVDAVVLEPTTNATTNTTTNATTNTTTNAAPPQMTN